MSKIAAINDIALYQYQSRKALSALISAQVGYCLLIWMFHTKVNTLIDKIHEQALTIIFQDKTS